MAAQTYTGYKRRIFTGYETIELAPDLATDKHIPINPPVEEYALGEPTYTDESKTTTDSLIPSIKWSSELAPSEITLSAPFKDPFQLFKFFPVLTSGGTWETDPEVDEVGTLIANMIGTWNHIKTSWLYFKIPNQGDNTEDIIRIYKGMLPSTYVWKGDAGGLLMEEATFTVRLHEVILHAAEVEMNCIAAFTGGEWTSGTEVGGFADWNDSGFVCDAVKTGYTAVNEMVFEFDGTNIRDWFKIESFTLTTTSGYDTSKATDALHHTVKKPTIKDIVLEISGKPIKKYPLDQIALEFCDRDNGVLSIYSDDTTDQEKLFNVTKATILGESADLKMPSAGENMDMTISIGLAPNGVITHNGKYLNLVDPANMLGL